MSSRTEASQSSRPYLDSGIKASHEIEASSQPKMAPRSHSSQKEAMRTVCSFLTLNAKINLSPLSNNYNVYKHHLLFSTGQDCPALLH